MRQAVSQLKGENPFDTNEGVDYFGTVFCPQPEYDQFRFDLTQSAVLVPDVTSVQEVNLDRVDDKIKFQLVVSTLYGTTSLEVLA